MFHQELCDKKLSSTTLQLKASPFKAGRRSASLLC